MSSSRGVRRRRGRRRRFLSNETPLPAAPRRKTGVRPVHPNSAAARIWGKRYWEFREI